MSESLSKVNPANYFIREDEMYIGQIILYDDSYTDIKIIEKGYKFFLTNHCKKSSDMLILDGDSLYSKTAVKFKGKDAKPIYVTVQAIWEKEAMP